MIAHLRKGKNHCAAVVRDSSEKNVRETMLQTLSSEKKEGEEVLQVPEQRFPCSPWRISLEQISTLQPTKDPMLEQVGMS